MMTRCSLACCIILSCSLLACSESTTPILGRSLRNGQKQSSKQLQEVLQHYLTNEELEAHMRDYVSRCGNIARLETAGKSVEGRELWFLEISDKPGQEEAEPNVKFVGNVHGDEPTGRGGLSCFCVGHPERPLLQCRLQSSVAVLTCFGENCKASYLLQRYFSAVLNTRRKCWPWREWAFSSR